MIKSKTSQLRHHLRIYKLLEYELGCKIPHGCNMHLEQESKKVEIVNTLYSTTKIVNPKTTYLWIGANLMVEYRIREAQVFIRECLIQSHAKLKAFGKCQNYVKDQISVVQTTFMS